MAFDLSQKVKVANPSASVDWKYGPWATLTEAKTNIIVAWREKGLTVGIIESGSIVEYWWKAGTADGDLALKTSGGTGDSHTHTNKTALDLINKDVNNNPTWNGGAWPGGGGGVSPTADNVDAALQGYTEGTPTGDSYIPFIGKVKAKLSAVTTVIGTLLSNTFAAKTHAHVKSDITDFPTIPAAQVQSDWNAVSGMGVVLNKPTIPAAQVQSDWNAVSGMGVVLNKPTIPTQYTDANVRSSALTGATAAATLANVVATDTQLTAWGKFMKLYSSLKALAFKDTVDYATEITNKPSIPAAQVNSDWSASSGLAQILNKPTIPAAYTHPTGDGNQHVPATGTTNSGKVLTAGATAGAMTWETPASVTPADNSITNAKLAQVATGTIKGRKTAATGNVEDLTAAEVRTLIGVDTDPIPLYCSDMTSDLTASTSVYKLRFVIEEARTLQGIVGNLITAPTGSSLIVDIKRNGTSILSSLLTFSAGSARTTTVTISGTIVFAAGDQIDVFVTQVGSTVSGKGLIVTLKTIR